MNGGGRVVVARGVLEFLQMVRVEFGIFRGVLGKRYIWEENLELRCIHSTLPKVFYK